MIAGAEYNQVGHKSKLLEIYKSFDSDLLALLDKAQEETLKVWELLDLLPLETWINDKLALLGDAAHPFLPRKLSASKLKDIELRPIRSRSRCRPGNRRCRSSGSCPPQGHKA